MTATTTKAATTTAAMAATTMMMLPIVDYIQTCYSQCSDDDDDNKDVLGPKYYLPGRYAPAYDLHELHELPSVALIL